MHYPAAVKYLFSFLDFEKISFQYRRELNLKRMNALLDAFGRPERKFTPILVAGTNGKGSTANFLASILSANQYQTGLYTSPHLTNSRERIRINGQSISESDYAELVTAMKYVLEPKRREISRLGPITFFEVLTLLAILYFAKKKAKFGIFEVGMGGRLDATNVLNPVVSIVTPISLDHVEHLGTKLAQVAGEKAAIIKSRQHLISLAQKREAEKVIRAAVRKKKAKGYFFGPAFRTMNERATRHGCRFDFRMNGMRLKNVQIQLAGKFQTQNAAGALAAAHVLEAECDVQLDQNRIRKGLRGAVWPGRFEIGKRKGRTVILDGAHNEGSIAALCEGLKTLFPKEEKIVILGTSREKNLQHILKPLTSVASAVVATKSQNPRAQEPKLILETLSEMGTHHLSCWSRNIKSAFEEAERFASQKSIFVVTGSLFLVAEARALVQCRKSI